MDFVELMSMKNWIQDKIKDNDEWKERALDGIESKEGYPKEGLARIIKHSGQYGEMLHSLEQYMHNYVVDKIKMHPDVDYSFDFIFEITSDLKYISDHLIKEDKELKEIDSRLGKMLVKGENYKRDSLL